jgi:hypothetical protein
VVEDWTEDEGRRDIGDGNDAAVLPVNVAPEAGQRVLNFDGAAGVLRRAGPIAVGECGCRKKMRRCDHTLERCARVTGAAPLPPAQRCAAA